MAKHTHTDEVVNSRIAKDSQRLVRTCQVLDQSSLVLEISYKLVKETSKTLPRPGIDLGSLASLPPDLLRLKVTSLKIYMINHLQ